MIPCDPCTDFEAEVERIARALLLRPCPPDEAQACSPYWHDWDRAHPEDRAHHLDTVRFILLEGIRG